MAKEFETVAIWLGRFPSEKKLEKYMAERYSDDDAKPISAFAADQGQVFYDHDFLEFGFRRASSARELLRGASFSTSYLGHVEAAWHSQDLSGVNTVILVWNSEIESPRSVHSREYDLTYLGTFACDTNADVLE